MQVVDVLGDDHDLALMLALEARQREVSRVGPCRFELAPPPVVEIVDEGRVLGEAYGRRHLAVVVSRPNAVLVAEGGEAGLRREAGAGQDNDALKAVHERAPTHLRTTSGGAERPAIAHDHSVTLCPVPGLST